MFGHNRFTLNGVPDSIPAPEILYDYEMLCYRVRFCVGKHEIIMDYGFEWEWL